MQNNHQNTISALNALKICASFANVPLDIPTLISSYALGGSITPQELLKIAKDYEFRAKLKSLNLKNLANYDAPFIIINKEGDYHAILQVDLPNDRFLVYGGGVERTKGVRFLPFKRAL